MTRFHVAALSASAVILALVFAGCEGTRSAEAPPPPASLSVAAVAAPAPTPVEKPQVVESKPLPPVVIAETPAPAPKPVVQPVTKASSAKPATHKLQRGETLTSVAKKYHVSLKDLVATNQIKDPNKVAAGTVLKLP